MSLKFALDFLLSVGLRTDKHIRGSVADWPAIFNGLFICNDAARKQFRERITAHPEIVSQLLLECSSSEVRNCFADVCREHFHSTFVRETPADALNICKIVLADLFFPLIEKVFTVFIMIMKNDTNEAANDLCIVSSSLKSPDQEVGDHWKHFGQYFKVFAEYAEFGLAQRQQLISMGVLTDFSQFLLKKNFTSKYHRPDLTFVACSSTSHGDVV